MVDFRNLDSLDYEIVQQVQDQLIQAGTLEFPALPSGLFSAALVTEQTSYTGYQQVWVRDNIHVAHALYVTGETAIATKTAKALMAYFIKHRHKFEAIIANPAIADKSMNRPHIRFNGNDLTELDQDWSHAQNDALGYFLWFYSKLVKAGHIQPSDDDWHCLSLFPQYFQAVQYWQDEENGHWEESKKIEASSIGTAMAGLKEYQKLQIPEAFAVSPSLVNTLIQKGEDALRDILPYECRQPDRMRRYDSALLFLIYPLEVVSGEMARRIVQDVAENLQGEIGIKRYLNDSFWAPDYKEKLVPEERTQNFSGDIKERDVFAEAGREAEWCIFDSIMSVIYGRWYRQDQQRQDLEKQTEYLNRALQQITTEECPLGANLCPELYYFEGEEQVPNDVVPLLWSQANLRLAFHFMAASVA